MSVIVDEYVNLEHGGHENAVQFQNLCSRKQMISISTGGVCHGNHHSPLSKRSRCDKDSIAVDGGLGKGFSILM